MRIASAIATSWVVVALIIAVACGKQSEPAPRAAAAPRGIEIAGGIVITRAEIDAFSAYFDALDPHVGVKQRTRVLLERHLLPLALVRHGFPAVHGGAMEQARQLCAVAGNAREFQRVGSIAGGERIEKLQRTQLPLPVADWARDESVIGAVSPPLETAEAVWVVTLLEVTHGLTLGDDFLTLFAVKFPANDAESLPVWLDQAHQELRGKLVHCDPDLVDALPGWLRT